MTSEIVNLLRKNSECLAPSIMLEAADTIERLTAERDDARQESCVLLSTIQDLEAAIPLGTVVNSTGDTPTDLAKKRGWDCFSQEDGK